MQLIAAKGGVWVLEQPSSSLAFRMRRFQELLGKQKVPQLSHECFFKMYRETVRTMVFSIYLESSTWSYNMHIYIYYIYNMDTPPSFAGPTVSLALGLRYSDTHSGCEALVAEPQKERPYGAIPPPFVSLQQARKPEGLLIES